MISVRLQHLPVSEAPIRKGVPVTFGLPWPQGAAKDAEFFRYFAQGQEQPLQAEVLARWPDGSVKWCLFDLQATVGNGAELGEIAISNVARTETAKDSLASINTVLQHMKLSTKQATMAVPLATKELTRIGTLRSRHHFEIPLPNNISIIGDVDFYPQASAFCFTITLRNANAADHPGGNWDLGNGGSVYFNEWSIHLPAYEGSGGQVSLEPGKGFETFESTLHIHQESSGGENWKSESHLNRHRKILQEYQGYKAIWDGKTTEGKRACPVIACSNYSVVVPEFWQNFPICIRTLNKQLVLDLFPKGPETELQGGEQKTHSFWLSLGEVKVTPEPLVWARSPLVVHAAPEWYAQSGALPYFAPQTESSAYEALVNQAIEGPDNFFSKREAIDEYGWRNYGDIWGDHEAVGYPTPNMVSHYNNQYDCILGLLTQFLRKPDTRWWQLAWPCAWHTVDIDIYHTTHDKAAYNGGLFWHTYHYAPADTGNHRSYPRSLKQGPQASTTTKMDTLGETAEKLKKAYAVGGGPASSHNYNAGLMLAYYLSGEERFKQTAIGLAEFVLNMEDPSRTPFRFLSKEYTGLATESGGGGYHGPGRASANSVLALLTGFQLAKDAKYLVKAEELIRRVSHPQQNLESLDLLNAELRWFYTMYLQALGEYLDVKAEQQQLDGMYTYAREVLLHYGRWMAKNERPILDTPEKLQYPTETWAAQDMRKAEVFLFAAKHAEGAEREMFLGKATWFFNYVVKTLQTYETKSLCRPVILMLRYGYSLAWWQKHKDAMAPKPLANIYHTKPWRMFVPQKVKAIKRAKMLVAAGVVTGVLAVTGLIFLLLI